MTRFLSLALVSLTLSAAGADAATAKAHKVARPSLAAVCAGRTLPFPAPSGDDTEAWTDSDYATWADDAWNAYCDGARPGSYEARACACADRFEY